MVVRRGTVRTRVVGGRVRHRSTNPRPAQTSGVGACVVALHDDHFFPRRLSRSARRRFCSAYTQQATNSTNMHPSAYQTTVPMGIIFGFSLWDNVLWCHSMLCRLVSGSIWWNRISVTLYNAAKKLVAFNRIPVQQFRGDILPQVWGAPPAQQTHRVQTSRHPKHFTICWI